SLGTAKLALGYQLSDFTPMSREQMKLGLTLLALALLLLLNSPLKPWYGGLGLDERSLILGFGLLVFLPGFKFLEWADSKQIPFEIIFLFGAGFALAMAFQSTGFDTTVAGAMSVLTGLHPSVAMVAIVLMMMAAGLVVSNTALASMALPIVYSLAQQGHLDVELFLMVATISASFAFVLPISTPPNAIALSSGAVRVGQMAAYGTLFSLLGALLLVLVATLYWQWVL
ncbi:MAG: SLC13 family permease, partial [Campylobacterales bacterium]